MRNCVTSRLRLPDLYGILISFISDADADLASFLTYCTPSSLKLLAVNHCTNNPKGINSKFYIGAFSEAARRTKKQVYFKGIDFRAKDLQTVVRAARNAEIIVFNFCCIHSSSSIDFGADLNYNTKFLSFQWWGCLKFKVRTTDWKTDPSKFSLIVDAISSSGLKASLQKLNIYGNETLPVSKVQKELNAKGMSHISVVEKDPYILYW